MIAALLDISSRPLQTLAAIVGLATAISVVVLVDASTIVSEAANRQYTETTFGRTATFHVFPADGTARVELLGVRPSLAETSAVNGNGQPQEEALIDLLTASGAPAWTRYVDLSANVRAGDIVRTANAVWVSSSYPRVGQADVLWGAIPSDTAVSDVLHVVVSVAFLDGLGILPASAPGLRLEYVDASTGDGDPARTFYRPMVIDAVAASIGTAQDPIDLLFVSDLPELPGFAVEGSEWLIGAPPSDVMVLEQLVANVRTGNPPEPAFTVRRIDIGESLLPLLEQQQVTARTVAFIALTVGGLSLIGIGLAGTRERANEFGVRRAIGVSTRQIFAGVVFQTAVEAMIAAALGIAFSLIAVRVFARQLVLSELPVPASVGLPIDSAIRGCVAALLIGVLASLLPAARAARLSVTQAMRV